MKFTIESEVGMIDLRKPNFVEITLGKEGQLWINIDGQCMLRAYECPKIIIEDNR